MTAQNITLTPVSPGVTEYIQATQGENNARSLTFRVLDAIGQPLDLTGCTVAFYVDRRESGVVQVAAILTGDNAAQVTLPSGACNIPGEWGCWVQVIKPGVFDLRADNLILRVQPCNIDQAGEASDEFGLLTQLITQAQEAIENANNAAEEAAATAESTATTVATNIINQQKSQPNGLATLNSSGKLAQMPTAADVGAVLPNLLLNPDFGVNQRGKESYTASSTQYTYDRWLAAYATVTREANTSPAPVLYMAKCVFQNTKWPNFGQTLENYSQYVGKTLTVRFWIKGLPGTNAVSLFVGDTLYSLPLTGNWQEVIHTFNPVAEGTASFSRKGILLQSFTASPAAGTGFYLAAPQVCVGAYAGDYAPPNPAEELAKCQRYYEKGAGVLAWVAVGNGSFRFPPIQFKAEKYRQPAVTIKDGDNQNITANEVSTSMFSGYRSGGARENTFTFTADAEIYS